jgi:hypothetical protein
MTVPYTFANQTDTIPLAELDANFTAVGLASNIANVPAGTIVATTVQGAINEIVSDTAASSGSSLVGFLQSGTGAVATTVQTKLRESVSVKDFGAVGNGTTDDTAAITAAIAAAGVGGNILVPAGMNCLVSSEVTFSVAGQQLSARGAKFTKAASFTGTCVIRVSAINVLLNGLEIEGTDQTEDGVITSAGAASGFTASNLKIRNCLYGISAQSNSNIIIDSCDIATTARNCIRAQNAAATAAQTNIAITNNRLDMSSATAATTVYQCFLVWGACVTAGDTSLFTTNVTVSGNLMTHVYDPTNSAAEIGEFRFINNGVYSNNTGINGSMLVSVGASNNVTVSGNSGLNQTFYGIEFGGLTTSAAVTVNQPCTNCSATGNTIKGGNILNYGVGIQGTYPSKGVSISGNSIDGTTLHGILVNDQWTDITISGNRIDITDTVSSAQHGVWCNGTATPIQEVVITGNVINGNSQGERGIRLENTQYATVTGNVIPNWTLAGVFINGPLATCDEISIVGNSFKGLTTTAIVKGGTLGDNVTTYANTGYLRTGTTAVNDLNLNLNLLEAWGTGTPQSVVTAGVGSIFHRTDGGASTCLYVKESGTGNTGWAAK